MQVQATNGLVNACISSGSHLPELLESGLPTQVGLDKLEKRRKDEHRTIKSAMAFLSFEDNGCLASNPSSKPYAASRLSASPNRLSSISSLPSATPFSAGNERGV